MIQLIEIKDHYNIRSAYLRSAGFSQLKENW